MPRVLVQTPGCTVRTRAGQLLIESSAQNQAVPLEHVQELHLVGNQKITTAVLKDLMERNIPLLFMDTTGVVYAQLQVPTEAHADTLERQVLLGATRKLQLARQLITGKIRNTLRTFSRTPPPAGLKEMSDKLLQADTIETLRGWEGHAARLYFQHLKTLLADDLEFTGRQYHPAPDPVNATFSLGYTLLLGMVQQAIRKQHLHPCFGVMHVRHGNTPSLALDLMEEFRPVVDRVALRLFRRRELRPEHFVQEDGRCRMTPEARGLFYRTFNTFRDSQQLEEAIHKQVYQFARVLISGEEYEPCLM